MVKVGRNAPCPCGSGSKFKKCCGALSKAQDAAFGPPPELREAMQLEADRFKAKEHRRRLMQGLGRPIISFENHGYRCVAVGGTIHWSKTWKTFHDFLFEYIKRLLTPEWGQPESAKPALEQHPLIRWIKQIADFKNAATNRNKVGIYTGTMTGVIRAYLGLAYDLYLCAHNAETQELLLKRLRKKGSFEGALYEAYVVGIFARAGFKIEFEDEGDPKSSHCEFTATHLQTGKKFSVEAKAIGSDSSRAGTLARKGIVFKQTPYEVKARK